MSDCDCARLEEERSKLIKALEDIRRHQDLIAGHLSKHSVIWHIADKAIKEVHGIETRNDRYFPKDES